jgi:hypothetical protein
MVPQLEQKELMLAMGEGNNLGNVKGSCSRMVKRKK